MKRYGLRFRAGITDFIHPTTMKLIRAYSRIFILFLILTTPCGTLAAVKENAAVRVSCEDPNILIVRKGNDFEILAPRKSSSFSTYVRISARTDWKRILPARGYIRMMAGDSISYEASHKIEDTITGTVSFHCYEIVANINGIETTNENRKIITCPVGSSVSYAALRNGKPCRSKWRVRKTQFKNSDTLSLNFDELGINVDWFYPRRNILKPGIYSVWAQDISQEFLQDQGSATFLGALFQRDTSSPYGFDDLTHWIPFYNKKADDYYGPKKGYCSEPFVSFPIGKTGSAFLKLEPD